MSHPSRSNSLSDLLAPQPEPVPRVRSTTPTLEGKTGKTQTVFIHKLYDMLEDLSISHLIWWSPNSVSFFLYPSEEFSKVLAQYFKHTNIASFIRQLNMYGFHKVNDNFTSDEKESSQPGISKWEFRHSTNRFRKGDLELLKLIKRRSSKNINSHKEVVNIKSIPPAPTSNPALPPTYVPDESEFIRQQYHQSLQLYHQQEAPPPPPGPSSPHPTEQPEDHSRPGSQLLDPYSLKILELLNSLNHLKNEHNALLGKYEYVNLELKRNHQDLIHLVDLLDKLAKAPPGPDVDRNKNKTPVNPLVAEDVTSPMSRPPVAAPTLLSAQISEFKNYLVNKTKFVGLQAAPPPPQPLLYHLDHSNPSRQLSNPNIIPQHYPLNPNYTVYNHEVAFRNVKMNETDLKNRHLLILMDPLQPIPFRKNSRTVEPPIAALGPIPVESPDKKHSTDPSPRIHNYQQYPFPPMTHQYLQPHVTHPPPTHSLDSLHRTNSLPNFDQITPDGPNYSRHSLTSIHSDSQIPRPQPRTSVQYPITPSYARNLPSLGNLPPLKEQPPRLIPYRLGDVSNHSSSGSTVTTNSIKTTLEDKDDDDRPRNVLPSVSELDKLIKTGNALVFNLLSRAGNGNEAPLDDDDAKFKKRKV